MYKKVITYTDFDGKEKTKSFYFNLTRPELFEMKRSPLHEMQVLLDRIDGVENPDENISYEDKDALLGKFGEILRNLVILSYGVKSDDGERFIKRVDSRPFGAGEDFIETMAYDALYVELLSSISNMVRFVRAIVPPDNQRAIDAELPKILGDTSLEITEAATDITQ